MILGYLDKEDRAYDLNFATLRMRIRVESGAGGARVAFSSIGAAGSREYRVTRDGDVSASVSMDHGGDRIPLLRPVPGRLHRHERGILFVAAPKERDPADPTYFLVKLRAMPEAVRFFFEDQEGTEIVSVPEDEVLRVERAEEVITVIVSAASVALPKEKLAYAVEFSPAGRAAPLLEGLHTSPAR